VIIPVTGINLNPINFANNLQVLLFNLGLSLVGFGLVLKSIARWVR